MKRGTTYTSFFAWLLLLTYLLNPFRVYQPYLNYQVNYEYISTVLCINKEKPETGCHGKCHLSKELKKTAEEESKKNTGSRSLQLEEFSVSKQISTAFIHSLLEEISYATYLERNYTFYKKHSNPPPQV